MIDIKDEKQALNLNNAYVDAPSDMQMTDNRSFTPQSISKKKKKPRKQGQSETYDKKSQLASRNQSQIGSQVSESKNQIEVA